MSGEPKPTGNVRFPRSTATAASYRDSGFRQHVGFSQIARRTRKHEIPERVRKQEAPGNHVIDVRRRSIVDRAFAIEALRTIGDPQKILDIDVAYERSRENCTRLASALEPFTPRPRGWVVDLPFVHAQTLLSNEILTLETTAGDVDSLGAIKGSGGFVEVERFSARVPYEGFTLLVLSIDGLIVAKTAAGRPKDAAGLIELRALREARKLASAADVGEHECSDRVGAEFWRTANTVNPGVFPRRPEQAEPKIEDGEENETDSGPMTIRASTRASTGSGFRLAAGTLAWKGWLESGRSVPVSSLGP